MTSQPEGGFFGRQQGKMHKTPALIPEDDVRVDQIDFCGNKVCVSRLQDKTEGKLHIFWLSGEDLC